MTIVHNASRERCLDTSGQAAVLGGEVVERWPHIWRFLRLEPAGSIDVDFWRWNLFPPGREDMAEAHEEWADFFEWRFQRQAAGLAARPIERHLLAVRTDSMAYCHRRLAAFVRGEDPGECVPQHVRRPDLDAESRRLAERIVAPQRKEASRHRFGEAVVLAR